MYPSYAAYERAKNAHKPELYMDCECPRCERGNVVLKSLFVCSHCEDAYEEFLKSLCTACVKTNTPEENPQ